MAAELPAKDVLCEAMEYLSKLGSNLRTRSENLKDKKIRREKLNNVLALQKAASKVLLICELSKKSLENVETGVRQVLEHIDISQASSSQGKTSKNVNKDTENKSKYFYFKYKSRKLRIKKQISVKHYSSAVVLANSMPKSILDKYPVYYDCKLYRMRERQRKLLKLINTESNFEKDENESTGAANRKTENESCQNNISTVSIPDSPTEHIDKRDNERKSVDVCENDISIISIPDSPNPNIASKVDEVNISTDNADKGKIRKSSGELTKERSYSSDRDECIKKKKNKDKEQKSGSSEKQKNYNKINRSEISRKNSGASNKSDNNEDKKKRFKKLMRVLDSSDESSTEEKGKKRKLSVSTNNTQSDDANKKASIKLSAEESNSKGDEKQNDDVVIESDKPLIKCVSLSKLLKPGVLPKAKSLAGKPHSKPKDSSMIEIQTKPRIFTKGNLENGKVDMQSTKEREEKEYWDQKRKEVSSFKSKSFTVNITRLPELSPDYLNNMKLKKITKSGITICEITEENIGNEQLSGENDREKCTSSVRKGNKVDKANRDSKQASTDSDEDLIAEANKVKNSLLNESDSDDDTMIADNEKQLVNKNNDSVKNALLNDSDSENKKNDSVKSALLNDSDSENQNNDSVKNALLNDSDSENNNSNNELQSIAQAEKAKNALFLNDSDSDSDTSNSKLLSADSGTTKGKKVKKPLLYYSESDSINFDKLPDDKIKKALLNNSNSDSESKTSDPVEKKNKEIESTSETEAAPKRKADGPDCRKDGNISEQDDKNSNEENVKNNDDLIEKNDENLRMSQRNERTPEKESLQPANSGDQAKSSLSNDSSEDKSKTPLSQRKWTLQSKKKRMRESIHAKKMLLTYSSSDTEDEQLKNVLKEIKDSLLHGSDEDNSSKKKVHKRQSRESSSSNENILKKAKKTIHDSSSSNDRNKRKKYRKRLDSESSVNSKSSSSKMVRSKSKPGNSSRQNSDAQDSYDKDIDRLADLNSLNKSKSRRRHSNAIDSTDESSASNTRSRKQRGKPTGLICEEMLKAETSSEPASPSGEENLEDDDDLPAVTVPNFNGGGEHLVKEDLLVESDSSDTPNEKAKKGESDEEKLNSKRRKVVALSSDSEVGSSRKKNKDVKLSDFEDSDDSEPMSRSKRKKKAIDSDASAGSSSNEEAGKKKRRRIKSVRDSDVSGSESETEGRKHGRKNIRKVMGKNQLEEATKKAAREEKERVARIFERQKMYNNLEFDESGKPDEVILDKVVLDFDPETKEPLIEVDRGLVKKLKPHQANGIKFMWNACFESAKRIKKDKGSGCILAHCMGLGKTLQVVSLTHTLLTHSDITRVNRVLVVCPLSTVLNWVNEFRMWLKHAHNDYDVDVYELSRFKQNSERSFQLSQWLEHGGVCVLGYEMFRNLSADNSKKFKKKMLKTFQEALVDPGPDLVVCDEGHLLKNEKTSLSQSMNRVKSLRRIVLTGTPLQNNLKEYYCMVQFVKPNLLGKYNEYLNRFVNPITNGQYTDSTDHDIKIMKRRSHVLHKMLDGAVQRRDYGVLAPFLPPKHEYVLFITLSEVQTKLYQHYLDNFSRRPLAGKSSGFLFPDFQSLQRIWTHPLVLKYNSERYEIMQQKKRDKEEEDSEGSLVDFIDDDSTADETSTEESSDDSSIVSDDSRKKSKKKKSSKKNKGKDKEKEKEKEKDTKGEGSRPRRGTRANPIDLDSDENIDNEIIEVRNENPTEWWIKLVVDEELDDMRNSHKLVLLFDILRQCEAIGDKLLVFSQSLYSLDLIEHFLGKVDEATQEGRIDEKLGNHVGSWSPGVDYFRLDGSTSCENRSIWCKNFNREDNPRARLFLISTRAGGLGINLVAANRVVIFDVSWNPSHDVQSIFRVYRFGQKKPCYVYRFLAMGTMEEKIYERQVTKQAISKRVIDEQQIDRHYAENDLAELYSFEPQPPSPRPIPPLPKDRLFAEMLREHEAQIYKYHEHDSLLENKEEETLSEEERKAAWEDFENEKNKPPPAPFQAPWPMHNGMVPSMLVQQQQQLAYAALASMLRKDMPNLNDTQLRDMLPLIYNANPQLMQKMSEIYKYSQPGMMNPGMMNAGAMNAAGGAGAMGGLGGASGLQYEPPWQRQQQQQQQYRLQQLMQQQQNQMGAKFYAGGLGSRDPVAMALQQQRAREIMLGNNSAGRPRGRPPMQPRAPPSDVVVDLDSD